MLHATTGDRGSRILLCTCGGRERASKPARKIRPTSSSSSRRRNMMPSTLPTRRTRKHDIAYSSQAPSTILTRPISYNLISSLVCRGPLTPPTQQCTKCVASSYGTKVFSLRTTKSNSNNRGLRSRLNAGPRVCCHSLSDGCGKK